MLVPAILFRALFSPLGTCEKAEGKLHATMPLIRSTADQSCCRRRLVNCIAEVLNKLRDVRYQVVIHRIGVLAWLLFTGWLVWDVVYPTVRDNIPLTVEQYQRWGHEKGSGRNYTETWLNSAERLCALIPDHVESIAVVYRPDQKPHDHELLRRQVAYFVCPSAVVSSLSPEAMQCAAWFADFPPASPVPEGMKMYQDGICFLYLKDAPKSVKEPVSNVQRWHVEGASLPARVNSWREIQWRRLAWNIAKILAGLAALGMIA